MSIKKNHKFAAMAVENEEEGEAIHDSKQVIVDELLCFLSNKLDTMDPEALTHLCIGSFITDEIRKSKDLLFRYAPANCSLRNIQRKGDSKT